MARPSSQATSGEAEVVAGEEIASGDDRLPGEESCVSQRQSVVSIRGPGACPGKRRKEETCGLGLAS